jgi:hypothetical protein
LLETQVTRLGPEGTCLKLLQTALPAGEEIAPGGKPAYGVGYHVNIHQALSARPQKICGDSCGRASKYGAELGKRDGFRSETACGAALKNHLSESSGCFAILSKGLKNINRSLTVG